MDYRNGSVGRPSRVTYLITVSFVLCAIVLICGCESSTRDLSTPHAALLGQWKPVSPGRAHIFFSPDTATYMPAESGESIALPYEVVEENVDEFWIKIRYVSTPSDAEDEVEPFMIEFSEDREGFFLYPASVPEKLEYVYVNDRQAP